MPEVQERANRVIETVRVREAVGVVHSREQLEKVIDRLLTSGFDRSSIDLMASQDAITRKLKTVYSDLTAAADAPGVPRRQLVLPSDQDSATALVFGSLILIGAMGAALPIVASGGALATAILAAAGGGAVASGIAKIIRDRIVGRSDQIDLEKELQQEGLVIFVRLREREQEERAVALMRDCGADKVHVHEVELSKTLHDVPLADLNPDPLLGSEKLGG
jgi:hypothetical protein